jgi:hypothetical protein
VGALMLGYGLSSMRLFIIADLCSSPVNRGFVRIAPDLQKQSLVHAPPLSTVYGGGHLRRTLAAWVGDSCKRGHGKDGMVSLYMYMYKSQGYITDD